MCLERAAGADKRNLHPLRLRKMAASMPRDGPTMSALGG